MVEIVAALLVTRRRLHPLGGEAGRLDLPSTAPRFVSGLWLPTSRVKVPASSDNKHEGWNTIRLLLDGRTQARPAMYRAQGRDLSRSYRR